MTQAKRLYINGVEVERYCIVYGASPITECAGSLTGRTVAEDIGDLLLGENAAYDFDRQSAVRLQEAIMHACGAELTLICESDFDGKRENVICVGRACKETLSPRAYTCRMTEGEYLVFGGSYGATWHAIDRIEAYLASAEGETIELCDAGEMAGEYPLLCVACIGDSITRGSQALPDGNGFGTPEGRAASYGSAATSHYFEQYLSYPANLHRALWKEYLIYNFGQGNATMRFYEDWERFYYRKTAKFASCLGTPAKDGISYDAAIVMLGTNDSGRAGGAKLWTEIEREDFLQEAERLFGEILAISPRARLALMTMPHCCDSHKTEGSNVVVRETQRETARTLAKRGLDLTCYDMASYTADFMGTGHGDTREGEIEAHADYYNIRTETGKPDCTHPNWRGYHTISNGVRALLSHLLEGAEAPQYVI